MVADLERGAPVTLVTGMVHREEHPTIAGDVASTAVHVAKRLAALRYASRILPEETTGGI